MLTFFSFFLKHNLTNGTRKSRAWSVPTVRSPGERFRDVTWQELLTPLWRVLQRDSYSSSVLELRVEFHEF